LQYKFLLLNRYSCTADASLLPIFAQVADTEFLASHSAGYNQLPIPNSCMATQCIPDLDLCLLLSFLSSSFVLHIHTVLGDVLLMYDYVQIENEEIQWRGNDLCAFKPVTARFIESSDQTSDQTL
jgi:hypothetical protein